MRDFPFKEGNEGIESVNCTIFTNYNEFKCPKLRQISIKTAIYLHISQFFCIFAAGKCCRNGI